MVSVTVMDVSEETEITVTGNFHTIGTIRFSIEPHVAFKDQLLEYNRKLIPLTHDYPLKELGIKSNDNVTMGLYRRIPPQQIDIEVLFRRTIVLEYKVESTESVLSLKNKIYEDQSLRPNRQALESCGFTMLDNSPIDKYIIDEELPMFDLEIAPPEPETIMTVALVILEKGYENEIVVDAYDDPYILYLKAVDEGLVDENDEEQREYYFTNDRLQDTTIVYIS